MENKFYVGIVIHKKGKSFLKEKIVLYYEEGYYIDLCTNTSYLTLENNKDYVDKNSLVEIDVTELKVDYTYLLSRRKTMQIKKEPIKKRKITWRHK